MEKRGLISLRGVLLRYLVQTVFCCVLALLLWFAALMCVINSGLALPANQAAQACQKAAQDVLPGMTAATFDETQLDSLCRYVLFAAPDSSEVLATNMDAGHLQRAMENRQGKTRWHFGYTQYYMTSKLQDGTVCLLQFDYAVPYAAPALRGKLPDVQTVHCILGILLLVGAVVWSTHRSRKFLARETARLTEVSRQVAEKKGVEEIDFSGAQVREYAETLAALQTMGQELTASLQAQWKMEQQQREQIIQLSHELKTPLTSISGYAEMIENGMAKEEDIRGFAAIIRKEAGRLLTLISDIIQLSELDDPEGAMHLERVDLLELALECEAILALPAEARGITFSVIGGHSYVTGDKGMLSELIYNLCDNAIRYNRDGGSVDVLVRPGVLTVRDTGIGIPKAHQDRIFERFYRVDKSRSKQTGGTGLGLSIVKHGAAYHKAKIEVNSTVGQGTAISVIFPKS